MATTSIADVIWIFNRGTGLVDIVLDGVILETCTLADAPQRLTFHRNEVAKKSGQAFTEASPYKRQNRGG